MDEVKKKERQFKYPPPRGCENWSIDLSRLPKFNLDLDDLVPTNIIKKDTVYEMDVEFHKLIAYKVRLLRKARNIIACDMAKDLGLSNAAYSNLERGYSVFSVLQLVKVARYLDVTMDYICNVKYIDYQIPDELPTSPEIFDLVKKYEHIKNDPIEKSISTLVKTLALEIQKIRNGVDYKTIGKRTHDLSVTKDIEEFKKHFRKLKKNSAKFVEQEKLKA